MTGLPWSFFIIGLTLVLLGWLLITPLVLVIDTTEQLYALKWRGLAQAYWLPGGRIHLWVMGWTKVINPRSLPAAFRPKASDRKAYLSAGRPQLSLQKVLRVSRTLLKSFRVRRFEVDWDTDDYPLNAYLYPVFGLLSCSDRQLRINFRGVS